LHNFQLPTWWLFVFVCIFVIYIRFLISSQRFTLRSSICNSYEECFFSPFQFSWFTLPITRNIQIRMKVYALLIVSRFQYVTILSFP
jgi:hypothetical protein